MLTRPDLFKLNKVTHEERLGNLMILLSDDDNATGSIADLPSNEDALKGLIQVDFFFRIKYARFSK